MKNPLLYSALVFFIFWWLVLAYLGTADGSEYTFEGIGLTVFMIIGGLAAGAAATALHAYMNRAVIKDRMAGKVQRGLIVNMGLLPTLKREPKRVNALPDLRELKFPAGTDLAFLDRWRERYQTTHPEHVRLLDAILHVMMADPKAPATHLKGGHGGHTLLEHGLLTAYHMEVHAKSWEWSGNRSKSTKKVLIPMRNPQYKFQPEDPLVVIAGLAHDIGKLECYIYATKHEEPKRQWLSKAWFAARKKARAAKKAEAPDGRPEIIGSKHEHDIVGSHMLGRLPEIWAIPKEDREVLLLAVGHYHHPADLPMEGSDKPLDDRLMCLTELLIHVDYVASALELGQTKAEAEQAFANVPSEAKQDTLLTAFADIVAEGDRINGNDTRYRVGQKITLDGQAYLFFHERSLMREIADRTGMDALATMGDGQFRLTRELLIALHEKGVLYTSHNGKEYGPVSALWKVEFRKKNGDNLAEWPATVIVRITNDFMPAMLNMDDADVIPLIKRPLHGEQRAKKDSAGASLSALADMDEDALTAATTLQPAAAKPAKPKPTLTLVQNPTPPEVPSMAPAVPVPSSGDPFADAEAADDAAAAPAMAVVVTAADGTPPPESADPFGPEADAPATAPVDPEAVTLPSLTSDAIDHSRAVIMEEVRTVALRIKAGRQPKCVPHPSEEGISLVRASNVRPQAPDFHWEDAVPTIEAGLVPGLRVQIDDEPKGPVLVLLFNVEAILANEGDERAMKQTGDMPVADKGAPSAEEMEADEPF